MPCMAIRRFGHGGGDMQQIKMLGVLYLATVTVLLLVSEASAHELAVDGISEVYTLGDTIIITSRVTNTETSTVTLTLEAVLQEAQMRFPPQLIYQHLTLGARESKNVQLYGLTVDEQFYSGTYTVRVRLIDGTAVVNEQGFLFAVVGAPEDMKVEVLVSKDQSCAEQTHVFIENDKVYLQTECSLPDVSVIGTLTTPDNTSLPVTLPTSVLLEHHGIYSLTVQAVKDGYRTVTITQYLSVLEQDPDLITGQRDDHQDRGISGFELVVLLGGFALLLLYGATRKRR